MSSTDLHALGRLGQTNGRPGGRRRRRLATRAVRGVPAATPRRRLPRSLLALIASLLAVLAYLGVNANEQTGTAQTLAALGVLPETGGEAAAAGDLDEGRHGASSERASRSGGIVAAPSSDEPTVPLADVDGLVLRLPHAQPVAVAFHEASLAEALELTPIGTLEGNDNPTKFEAGPDTQGASYRVLSSRGRPRPATSAVDVVVSQGATVMAPVGGTVVEARKYALYGSTRDWRVVIEPHERPDLQVVMIHLHQPAVEPGDEVVAGRTPVGVARQLPFTSQVDYVVGASLPHVHLEVKAANTPKPADPNAPAVEPGDALDVSSG